MFAAVALLVLMIFTVAMFEVTVNNRPRHPKAPKEEPKAQVAETHATPDVPKS
ncbi:hypothetical protein [Sphaerisporangium fuscum]|uniref:hypothetical protein n=1 Tax=Sphaerisporangium fuscum TaxID=2835868 RepID=UPI001BDC7742|nr:hypothetical protein [Sphaerisporangium fuscum]